jgi:putative Holliday junction resolvase
MARILGIDYGTRRVGIAVTDPLQIICKPLIVVENKIIIEWLKKYLATEQVETIVLGMPLRFNGDDTHATQPVKEFHTKLEETFKGMKIVLIDERLTSKMARQSLIDSGVPKQKRREKGILDSVSASLILQTYLQRIG